MRWQKSRRKLNGIVLPWFLLIAGASIVDAQHPALVQFQQGSKRATGLRLVHEPHRTILLGRDGWIYDSARPPGFTETGSANGRFTVIPSIELRSRLQAEFGPDFEVVPTEHYLVVQPRRRGDRWPNCFESMYRQFVAFMEHRGVSTRQGRFPLVAIVLPDEAAMQTAFDKIFINPGRVAGVYDLSSNRVLLHDTGSADGTAATVRHEAAHQTAYNTGIHSRISITPRWIVEGIASMFEPAIMESSRHGTRGDRVNQSLLLHLRRRYGTGNSFAHDVQHLVSHDAMFERREDVEAAYAVGWAMTFYLAERQPRQFAAYLAHTNRLPPFEKYERTQRLRDFEAIIGSDVERFATHLERFLETL